MLGSHSSTDKSKAVWLWIGLILLLIILSSLLKTYFGFKNSSVRNLNRINFILSDGKKEIVVFSFSKTDGVVTRLSADEKVTVTRGFGEYELGKVYSLGELEKKGSPLLLETVQENLSIPLFDLLLVDNFDEKLLDDPKKLILDAIWKSIQGKIKTKFNKYDLITLYLRVKKIDSTSITKVNTTDIKKNCQDANLRNESFSIEVLNATDHSGLAQKFGTFIEQSGGRVVRIADAVESKDKCLITFSSKFNESYTLEWFKRIYPNCQVEKEDSTSTRRADFTFTLGEEYWKILNEKW